MAGMIAEEEEEVPQQVPDVPQQETCVYQEVYRRIKEGLRYKRSCSRNLTHQVNLANWNRIQSCTHEGHIQFTIRKNDNGLDGDKRLLFKRFRTNQDETVYEKDCFRNLTHHRTLSIWNQLNINCHQEVMEFTNQAFPTILGSDLRAFKGGLRSYQKEKSYKPNCFANLMNQSFSENFNQTKIYFGLEVIQFLNRRILHLPYLGAHGFNTLQTRVWRPGEISDQSYTVFTSILKPSHDLSCTSTHHITQSQDLPYVDPWRHNLPFNEPKEIKSQRLYSDHLRNLLNLDSMNQDAPRHHCFLPKLSRPKYLQLSIVCVIQTFLFRPLIERVNHQTSPPSLPSIHLPQQSFSTLDIL
ncbi:unnamed protein product [Cochlearia groenlandica]